MVIEFWPVSRLVPYAKTLRRNDHAVTRMAEIIAGFGFKLPLLVRGSGELVDGHLRLKAARKLQLTEVPVIRCDDDVLAEDAGALVAPPGAKACRDRGVRDRGLSAARYHRSARNIGERRCCGWDGTRLTGIAGSAGERDALLCGWRVDLPAGESVHGL
jgi:hypothetical protein